MDTRCSGPMAHAIKCLIWDWDNWCKLSEDINLLKILINEFIKGEKVAFTIEYHRKVNNVLIFFKFLFHITGYNLKMKQKYMTNIVFRKECTLLDTIKLKQCINGTHMNIKLCESILVTFWKNLTLLKLTHNSTILLKYQSTFSYFGITNITGQLRKEKSIFQKILFHTKSTVKFIEEAIKVLFHRLIS